MDDLRGRMIGLMKALFDGDIWATTLP